MSKLSKPAKIMVLNGPNLNRLGKREPGIYGSITLPQIEERLIARGAELGIEIECHQSNHEGQLIDLVHDAADSQAAVIINPGGLTHTSVALRDALAEIAEHSGFIEVHISNVHAREAFRAQSYLSPIARGVIAGLGAYGYVAALDAFAEESN